MSSKLKYSKKFKVNISDANFTKKIKPSRIFECFQEVAAEHACKLGVGLDQMQSKYSIAWVLVKMRADISKYPELNEEFTVHTWYHPPGGMQFRRDFYLKDSYGTIIGKAVSVWVVVDVKTHKLKKPEESFLEYFIDPINENSIDCRLGKINPKGESRELYKVYIGCSQTDVNGHVNNSEYINFVTDCLSMDEQNSLQIKSLRISFRDEALPGETIKINKYTPPDKSLIFYVEGTNISTGKKIFTAETYMEQV